MKRAAKSGQVWRDDMKIGQPRNEIAEHMARIRQAMQQLQLRRTAFAGFAIENVEPSTAAV